MWNYIIHARQYIFHFSVAIPAVMQTSKKSLFFTALLQMIYGGTGAGILGQHVHCSRKNILVSSQPTTFSFVFTFFCASFGQAERMEHWTTLNMIIMAFCLLSASKTVICNIHGKFLEDLMTTFHARQPTVIIGGEWLPELCFTNQRILCLKSVYQDEDLISLAQHMELLQQRRYQDAVIFIGGIEISRVVEMLAGSIPSLFRSPCPVFMSIEHESFVNLRLDSNIIFFEGNESHYTLTDRYVVKGGNQISQKLGSWSEQSGMRLHESIHRWKRRRDLQGAAVINTLAYYRNMVARWL